MAITLRAGTTTVALGTRTNTTVTAPSGATTGDVVVVSMTAGVASSTAVTITPPSGWETVGNITYGDTDPWTVRLVTFARVYDGAGSWVFTHASASAQAYAQVLVGVDNTTIQDVTAESLFQGVGTTIDAPSIAIATVGAWGYLHRGSWDGNAITPPTNWTERLDTPVQWIATREWAATGETGTVPVPTGNGSSGSVEAVIHGAFRPASSGGTQHAATGTIAVTTAAAGSPTALLVAAGTIAALTTAVGAPVAVHPATGTISVVTGAAGEPTAPHPATATTAVTTTAAGTPTAAHPASGTVIVTTTASGTADVLPGNGTHPATGTIPVVTTTSGAASQRHAATGTVVVTTSAVGAPSARFAAAGTCAVVTSATAEPGARYAVGGTVIVITTASGTANVFDPGAPVPIAPPERTLTVLAETRTLVVPAESRRLIIAATSRTVIAEPEE